MSVSTTASRRVCSVALAALVASTQCLHSAFGDLASPEWSRLAQLLSGFLEQRELRGATAELARHVPLCKATAVLLARLAVCVEVEERPEVFRSLCTAAAHMAAAQEEPSQELGEAMQMLREAAKIRRSAPSRATALQSSDEDSSVTSDCPSSASDESAPTVASTADLEGSGAGQALQVTACYGELSGTEGRLLSGSWPSTSIWHTSTPCRKAFCFVE
eukprot:s3251_g11.t1